MISFVMEKITGYGDNPFFANSDDMAILHPFNLNTPALNHDGFTSKK